MSLQDVVNHLNNQWLCGNFEIMSHADAADISFENSIQTDDIIVSYDYCDDELDPANINHLVQWLYDDPNGGWNAVRNYLSQQGFAEIEDQDGSGNGLYYGAALFRKI